MFRFYNILPKKSIFLAFSGIFLFFCLIPVLAAEPNDPKYILQKQFWTQINAKDAWNISTKTDAVVAVIDIGVDYNHPDLRENIWTNYDEIPGNNVDDDKNGYIDDIHGWNFVDDNALPKPEPNSGFGDYGTLSHGTAIAGLIGAVGNNSVDGTGLIWNAKIMPIRAINSYGVGSYANIEKSVAYALENGAGAISMSFIGDTPDQAVYNIMRTAYEKGIVTVVAAGNDRYINEGNLDEWPLYPICYDSEDRENWILGVTSVDNQDRLSSFANFGQCVDLTAPGEDLYSTEISNQTNNFTGFGGGWQGTSFSAPLVAGTIAMIKGLRPDWTAQELINNVILTADDISASNPDFNDRIGYGRLNVGRAVFQAEHSSVAGSADRICFNEFSKIYCYDIAAQAKTYLVDTKENVIDIDWFGKNYVAVIISGKLTNRVDIYTGRGLLIKSIQINNQNSIISLFDIGGSLRFIAGNFDTKTGRTYFNQYSIDGVKLSNFYLSGDWRNFQAVGDKLYAATISQGKLTSATFDLSGKKLFQISGPTASKIISIKAGHLWSRDNYEIAIIAKDSVGSYKFIADTESRSYLKERLSYQPQSILLIDKNMDGFQDIFAYRFQGGIFDIVTGKGKKIGSFSLPLLK